jgi:transposase
LYLHQYISPGTTFYIILFLTFYTIMSNNSHLPIEDRWAIIALKKHAGWKQARIAKQLKCTQAEVSKVLNKYKEHDTIEDLPKSGRPPLLEISPSKDNIVANSIRNSRKSTSRTLKNDVEMEFKMEISCSTIRRIRKMLGFRPVHYRRRPKIMSGAAKQRRLHYCLDNLDNDWKNLIFTDESMFVLTDEHEVVWKRPGSPAIERPTEEYPAKVMIWGGIWWEGRTKLCFIEGTVDADKYQDILMRYLVRPHLIDQMEVLQDGAKPHTAGSTWEFIDEQGIDMVQNPAYSPELNAIEKVWGWIKHEVNKQNIQTMDELKQWIEHYWDNIPQATIQQFIRHNTTVVNDIIVAEGGTITEENRHRSPHVQ